MKTTITKLKKKIDALGYHTFERDHDGMLHVSGEHGDDAIDYYGEFRGGYPWINPKLEALAEEFNGYWEWDNPASNVFIER